MTGVRLLHVPKTAGSSFQAIVLRAGCGVQVYTNRQSGFAEARTAHQLIRTKCPHSFAFFDSWHWPLPPTSTCMGAEQCITIVRRPAARAASGFWHGLHDCPFMQRALGLPSQDDRRRSHFWKTMTLGHVHLYAGCVGACASRMLAGLECGRCTVLDAAAWVHRLGGNVSGAAQACLREVWREAFQHLPEAEVTLPRGTWESMRAAIEETFRERLVRERMHAQKRRRASNNLVSAAANSYRWDAAALQYHAASRIRSFAFVGVSEEYNATLNAFAAYYNVSLDAENCLSTNWRKGSPGSKALSARTVLVAMEHHQFASDTSVYDEGRRKLRAIEASRNMHRVLPCHTPTHT